MPSTSGLPAPSSMDYPTSVAWLLGLTNYEHLPTLRYRSETWDLRRVESLLHRLGNPHLGAVTIHIAGTKGKGSTAALLSAALTSCGYQTGLYTSPHLHTIRERLAVNGDIIGEEGFARLASTVRPHVEELNTVATYGRLTTFEALTAMAFLHFKQSNAQFQVVEVGLGGRLDATNVVVPAVCAITSISIDHTQFLGDTVDKIAAEKAGIIKPDAPVVSAPQPPEALDAIERRCREVGVPLTLLGRDVHWRCESRLEAGQDFTMWGAVGDRPIEHELRTGLRGPHQLENATLAMTVLEHVRDLHYPLPIDDIAWGFSHVNWPGRLEVVKESPLVVVDGAHNAYSAMRLVEAVKEEFPKRLVQLVFGTSADKDISGMTRELARIAHGAIAVASRHPRSLPTDKVADALWEGGVKVRPETSVAAGVDRALKEAGGRGMVLVTGSLFVVAEAREHLLGIEPELYPSIS